MTTASHGKYCTVCGRILVPGHACTHGAPPLPPSGTAAAPPTDYDVMRNFKAAAPPPPPKATAPRPPRRSIVEILLDPRSIQWLLASGGVLLVTGLVIWLASLGIFENPHVVAGLLGIGTVLLLGIGWWVIRNTSLRMAGQAITLLACLIMPLNLWFYHSHQLLTLDGNLWVPAVVCCALYAASALVLRDPLFVYVLMAGVAGTGMLILTDMHRFAEIASPSVMLVIMGLIGIHAERAFAPNEGPFSRKTFGMAFFFSGHVLLAGGLLLLLGAQAAAWVIKPVFASWNITAAEVTTVPALKWLAVAMVLAGTYAYVYSDLVVRKVGAYIYPAAFTLLWAELLGLQMLDLKYGPEIILATVSFTALLLNVMQAVLSDRQKLVRTIVPLATLLSSLPVTYGVVLHVRATHAAIHETWPYTMSWGYVGAMVLAAAACRIGAYLHRRTDATLSGFYFFLTGAATLVGAAGLLSAMGVTAWSSQAPILMLIPIAYLIASRLYRQREGEWEPIERDSLLAVARVATGVMLFSVLASATHITPQVFGPVEGQPLNLALCLFFAEGAIFYILLSGIMQRGFHVFVATAMAGGAVWQGLSYFHTRAEVYMVTFAILGLAMLIGSRVARGGAARSINSAGNALMTLSFLSSALMVASRLLVNAGSWSNASLLGLMMVLTLVAAVVVGHPAWRHAFIVMTVINGLLVLALLGVLSNLTGWQKAEIFSVVGGLALLVVGHIGWYREQGTPNDTASFNLMLGAILAGLPVLIGAVVNRFAADISMPDEIALLTISALMLISGVMLQLRTTTIMGGSLLALHVAILLGFAGWKAQLALGVYLAIGGAVIFLVGLGLAVYRERLLQLPGRIQRREGLFRVLAWR